MNVTLMFLLLLSAATGYAADRLERSSPLSILAGKSALTAIQVLPDYQVMVGESGHILLHAADGLVTQARVPVDVLLTSVFFPDSQNGWAVGHDGVVLHSADGGHTWDKQLDGHAINQLLLAWANAEVTRLQVSTQARPGDSQLANALDSALFAQDDIKAGSNAGPVRPLLDVWFKDARCGWVVGAYGIFLSTADGGYSWSYVSGLDNPDRLHLNSILGLADGSLLVAGEGGRIYRSADNGTHWESVRGVGPASLYKLIQLKSGRVLAMGFGGTLLNSTDQGQTWQKADSTISTSLYGGSQLADGSVLLAGQGGGFLYSEDGQHFKVWRSPNRASWLGVAQASTTQVTLVGSAGLQAQALSQIKEQLQ